MRYIVCTLLPKNKELVAKAAALGADYQECVKTVPHLQSCTVSNSVVLCCTWCRAAGPVQWRNR